MSGVGKKEEGDRRGRRRMRDGGCEGVEAQATPPATGSRSLHSIDDDVFPTASRTPPTSQHSTRQLSQSCRERNPQRETILSTRNAASSTHFAVGSCVSRDDESPETFPSPVTRRLHPRFHHKKTSGTSSPFHNINTLDGNDPRGFCLVVRGSHARPSNDTELTDCRLLGDETNAHAGNPKERESRTGATWPATQASLRPVKAGPRGHDAGASGRQDA